MKSNKPMHWYAFQVKGWINEQVVQAPSPEEAIQEADDMAAGEDNILAFRKVSSFEAKQIIRSWG